MHSLDTPSNVPLEDPVERADDCSSFKMDFYATEPEACEAFDQRIESSKAFRLYREVRGEYIQPMIATEERGARIDRILVPLKKALDAGWTEGAIGVEIKSSAKTQSKFGPVAAQALDYQRCAFRLDEGVPGLIVIPTWVFIFPLGMVKGPVESMMTQNRVGTCSFTYGDTLRFHAPNQCLNIFRDGVVSAFPIKAGKKRGSR